MLKGTAINDHCCINVATMMHRSATPEIQMAHRYEAGRHKAGWFALSRIKEMIQRLISPGPIRIICPIEDLGGLLDFARGDRTLEQGRQAAKAFQADLASLS